MRPADDEVTEKSRVCSERVEDRPLPILAAEFGTLQMVRSLWERSRVNQQKTVESQHLALPDRTGVQRHRGLWQMATSRQRTPRRRAPIAKQDPLKDRPGSGPGTVPRAHCQARSDPRRPSRFRPASQSRWVAAGGHDFIAQGKLLYRIAACGGDDPVAGRSFRKEFRRQVLRPARAQPRGVAEGLARQDGCRSSKASSRPTCSTTVIYPFAGADLYNRR